MRRHLALLVAVLSSSGVAAAPLRVLAEGTGPEVEEPFVAVVRDLPVYEILRRQTGDRLPALEEGFFAAHAVVAAFAGTKPTPGYAVAIEQAPTGALRIVAESPPKDAILAQVLTYPWRVVAVPIDRERFAVPLDPDPPFLVKFERHRVSGGEVEVTGGIRGERRRLTAAGEITVGRLGALATLLLEIHTAGEPARSLRDAATAAVEGDRIVIPRLDGGTLAGPPCPAVRASATLAPALVLELASVPCTASDALSVRARIEASPARSGPPKRP